MFKLAIRYSAGPITGEAVTSCPPACPVCARLRAAALKIVGTAGLEQVSIERLAAEAGVDVPVLRRHYDTPDVCLHATYDEVAVAIYEDFADAMATHRGWYEALRAGSLALLRRLSAHPAEARLCFAEIHKGDFELLRRRVLHRRRLVALFVRELGRRRQRPETYSVQLELLIGAGFQAISDAVARGQGDQLERLAPELESRAFVFEPAPA